MSGPHWPIKSNDGLHQIQSIKQVRLNSSYNVVHDPDLNNNHVTPEINEITSHDQNNNEIKTIPPPHGPQRDVPSPNSLDHLLDLPLDLPLVN